MKIGALAEATGLTVSTIRYYEAEGLIAPARSPGGTRVYGPAERARLEAIIALTALDVSLARVRALLAVPENSATGDEAAHKRVFQSRVIRRDLRALIDRAEAAADALKADEARAIGCFRCKESPTHAVCTACPTGAMAAAPLGRTP